MPLFSRQQRPVPGGDGGAMRPEAPGATASSLLRRYRPLETRAAGGFGSVEVCLDSRLQRRVAIKRMPLASRYSTAPAETRATALAEARTASLLQHPNIVSVIDFTYDDSFAYLVMEYVDGMTLEEFLREVDGNSLTFDECACIADALVQALSFAHENGVLHLDIKPANVLIDRSGHVKLTDFGMATLAHAGGFGEARGGTVGYMPPEQVAGEAVDERADVFSLAAVLYESLCATAPFRAGTPADSVKRIKRGVVDPSSLLPDLPAPSAEVLLEALSYDPGMRPADVAEFGDAFLARLGSPRAGRRSLAAMIAEITSDEAGAGEPGTEADRVWELDPAEGYLGSRTPRARRLAQGAVAGVSCAAASASLLAMAGLASPLAVAAAAAAVGLASAAAPQLGSALVAAGLAVAVGASTDPLPALPVLVALVAVFAGWWCVWGRSSGAASAVFALAACGGCLGSGGLLLAGPAAAVAGFLLAPGAAAATILAGCLFARLLAASSALAGALGWEAALAAVADPGLALGCAAVCAGAALTAAVGTRLWDRVRDSRGRALMVPACIIPGAAALMALCLANPVENTGAGMYPFAMAMGMGFLSSIIEYMCFYLLGLRRESSEADRT